MSADEEANEECANCGKAAVDDVKLKKCACKLVQYCSIDCQKDHRPKHKKACKKQMGEIRDKTIFSQPDISHFGDCPICLLPLPVGPGKWMLNSCCSKRICIGCDYTNKLREVEQRLQQKCPFCREPIRKTDEEIEQDEMKRVQANDPIALCQMGKKCYFGGDYDGAFKYWTKSAELGNMDGHYELSCLYHQGRGVEMNKKKEVHHLEQAAIGGHLNARYNLGCEENRNGRIDRMFKHFIIAAKLGDDGALDEVKKGFQRGQVSKEDYAATLRGHQAALDETKSEQRVAAEADLDYCALLN
eukprot:scaffold9868_cov119-Skeletonema_menzelii.AAC.3